LFSSCIQLDNEGAFHRLVIKFAEKKGNPLSDLLDDVKDGAKMVAACVDTQPDEAIS
jgi:hypothetical protein